MTLAVDDPSDLLLDLARLLQYEVYPWKLFFDLGVQLSILCRVRVCVEDMCGEPACVLQLNDLQGRPTWTHSHPPSHQLKLLALLLLEQVQVHGSQELLQLERSVL